MKHFPEQKIALITGGNSGIGYLTARLLSEAGCRVTISGRNLQKLMIAAESIGADFQVADMKRVDDIKQLAEKFDKTGLDYLVNNAGMTQCTPIENYTPDTHEDIFRTNLFGPLLLIKELLPSLQKKQGSISNISSTAVIKGSRGTFLYAATKGAIEAITKNLAVELAPRNIRINAVSPGPIETPIFSKAGLTEEQKQMLFQKHQNQIPLSRRGKPIEVAHVIISQLTSEFVTGSVWTVDGGYTTV